MRVYSFNCTLVLLSLLFKFVISFEVFSTAVVTAAALGKFIYDNSICRWRKECCTENEIPADFIALQRRLEENVYGQHLVQEIVVNALKAHWNSNYVEKPLTLSFHGWPGGGKNYVTNFIIESLYKKGIQSEHVHFFNGRIHFPLESNTNEYKENVFNWVKNNVSNCPRQIFVFDEVDKMPPGILNGLKPILDYNRNIDKVDYRNSIFIFLSNTGGTEVTSTLLRFWELGRNREEIQLADFEKLIMNGAFNEEGGFHKSDVIASSLIDHYIPFLPLEEKHVELCILSAFKNHGINDPLKDHIRLVLNDVAWGPYKTGPYSKTGCKRLSQKVALLVQKYYR